MSARNSLYTNPKLCKHLSDYKRKHGGVNCYSSSSILKTIPTGFIHTASEKIIPRCVFCNGYEGRFFFCLICSSISCWNHTHSHLECNNGHDIVVDVDRAELYCCSCRDQVYDPDFDKLVVLKQLGKLPKKKRGSGGDDDKVSGSVVRSSKRRKLDSDMKELGGFKECREERFHPLGLRGLNNLGSTCFMNSVLQALIHAPPLRNYFLSGQHKRDQCSLKRGNRLCLMCDIDFIFSSMFSADRKPYSPAPFLYSWWQHSENLASYEQQDCHEFFISMLDGIHERNDGSKTPRKDNKDCKCVAHRIFSGLLKSDVTCMTCGCTSTTYDPCLDISLDLDTTKEAPTEKGNKSGEVNNQRGGTTSTLLGCLDFFTRSEELGSDQKLHCQNCKKKQDAMKRMSIRRLPTVLCLHIKRFEHSFVRRISRKIDRYLQFPFSLDMTPYLSSTILRNEFGNRIYPFEGHEMDGSAEFEIFAVITHSGMLESGHYMTYLRLKNQWYRCDDAWVSEVDEAVVRASQCYMVFYAQKMVFFKGNEDLSGLPISPWSDPVISFDGRFS